VPILTLPSIKEQAPLPPYSCAVDWSNPLSRGLAYAALDPISFYDQKSLEMPPDRTGSVVRGHQIGVMRGFGPTYGTANSTDRIETAFTGQSTQRTFAVWAMRNGAGGNSVGRIFESTGNEVLHYHAGVSKLYFARFHSGTNGYWHPGDFPAGVLWHIVVTYDSSSLSNDPQFYINGVPVTTTEDQAPVGTPGEVGVPYYVGNDNGLLQSWDGLIGPFLIWDRLLSPGEIWSLYDPLTRWDLWQQPTQQTLFSYDVATGHPTTKRWARVPGMRYTGTAFQSGWTG
jgi:hypothetical protein